MIDKECQKIDKHRNCRPGDQPCKPRAAGLSARRPRIVSQEAWRPRAADLEAWRPRAASLETSRLRAAGPEPKRHRAAGLEAGGLELQVWKLQACMIRTLELQDWSGSLETQGCRPGGLEA